MILHHPSSSHPRFIYPYLCLPHPSSHNPSTSFDFCN
jgi:hypothetical protein